MNSAGDEFDAMIDLYLDGQLADEQREEFERRLEQDEGLRAQVEMQRRIDGVLRERYTPASVDFGGRGRPHMRVWAIAAVLVLAVSAGVYAAFFMPQRAPFDQPSDVYRRLIASGFEPMQVCTDDGAFRSWMERKFDESIVIPDDLAGVELLGWHYKRVLTPRTGVLLAKVDGEEVIVLVERRSAARRLGDQDGLHVYRRDLGGVAMYEVSPLHEARLLPHARRIGG